MKQRIKIDVSLPIKPWRICFVKKSRFAYLRILSKFSASDKPHDVSELISIRISLLPGITFKIMSSSPEPNRHIYFQFFTHQIFIFSPNIPKFWTRFYFYFWHISLLLNQVFVPIIKNFVLFVCLRIIIVMHSVFGVYLNPRQNCWISANRNFESKS